MPVSPMNGAALARATADIYAEAELLLLEMVARRLRRGLTEPSWAESKLLQVQALRREISAALDGLTTDGRVAVEEAIRMAYNRGLASANADLRQVGIRGTFIGSQQAAISRMVVETVGLVQATHFRVLRATEDAYRQTVAAGSSQVLTGALTRREAAQQTLNRLLGRGITGLRDSAGRNWDLSSYVEMAVRTAAGRAAIDGHLGRLRDAGERLVIVSGGAGCPLCLPWEGVVLAIDGISEQHMTVLDAQTAGLFHVNCVVGSTEVAGPLVRAAYARWYEGQVVVIRTACGDVLTITPNHPILTRRGWIPAGLIVEGEQVARYVGQERMRGGMSPDHVEMPARIEEIADALNQDRGVVAVSVPASAEHFHGDGLGGKVNVVLADRSERGQEWPVLLDNPSSERSFGEVGLADFLYRLGPPSKALIRDLLTPDGGMGSFDLSAALLACLPTPFESLSFGSGLVNPHLEDPSAHGGLSEAQGSGDSVLRLAGRISSSDLGGISWRGLTLSGDETGFPKRPSDFSVVEADVDIGGGDLVEASQLFDGLSAEIASTAIVQIERRHFAGHVYNLETEGGWYSGNGIVIHNCGHSLELYQEGRTREYSAPPWAAQYNEDREQLRYLERGVRQWKRREVLALDDQTAAAAGAHVRQWQGRIREHVDETGLIRQRQREQLGVR